MTGFSTAFNRVKSGRLKAFGAVAAGLFYFLYFNAEAMKFAKSGWAAFGLDLNSG